MSLEAFVNGQKAKTKEGNGASVRFDLKLDDPTDQVTNEFSYAELVRKETAPEPTKVSAIFSTVNIQCFYPKELLWRRMKAFLCL